MQPTIVREVLDDEGRIIPMWFDPQTFFTYEVRQVLDREGVTRDMWVNLVDPADAHLSPPEGSYQISPFTANLKWDITQTPMIQEWSCEVGYCDPTGVMKTVDPETVEAVRTGTRMAVTEDPLGTLYRCRQDWNCRIV
jgi:hypothetical protein